MLVIEEIKVKKRKLTMKTMTMNKMREKEDAFGG